ncbi:MAG: urease accessory protein [Pseudomonadota bacterium]|jgi:hypothetical protein
MDLLLALGLGLLLGMQHATDADHLAAVATLATRERSLPRALRLGTAWGLGHTLTLLAVAAAVAGLGWVITDETARRFEQLVGLVLIVLGARLAWRLRAQRIHFHGHAHPGRAPHFHGHSHAGSPARPAHAQDPHRHGHRMPMAGLVVGMVHGLAGSAALALLAGAALPSPGLQLLYIALFGAGSLLGMALLTGALAVTLRATARRLTAVHQALNVMVAGASVVIGLHLVWSAA